MAISTDMLAAFAKVAETGNVSAAALALGVGKSAVSKRIAQLEAALKSTLFSRSTRRVALTPAGEAYLEFARRALAEISAADEHLRGLRSELSGRIRVTAPVSWGQRVLTRLLPDFLHQHAAIEIDLVLGDQMLDLARERIDLALRWTSTPVAELSSVPVARVAWALVASPAYLARAGTPASPADLAGHDCMCYWRESADDAWTLRHGDRLEQVRVRSRYHANNPDAVADAALAGLGVAQLPRYLCDDGLAAGRLLPVLEGWVPQTKFGTHISAVAAPERMRLARTQALVGFMRQRLAGGG